MNKHIYEGAANGILYNVLDKPTKIAVNGKGTVDTCTMLPVHCFKRPLPIIKPR